MDCRTHAAGKKVNVRATMLSLHRGKKQATGDYVYYHVDEGRAIEQLFIFQSNASTLMMHVYVIAQHSSSGGNCWVLDRLTDTRRKLVPQWLGIRNGSDHLLSIVSAL